MTGKVEKGVDFGIDEDDVVTANSLNKHLGNIVQSLPPLLSVEYPPLLLSLLISFDIRVPGVFQIKKALKEQALPL